MELASPPPLPRKVRQSPPASNGSDAFTYRFPEVHGHTEISSSSVHNGGGHVVKIRIRPRDDSDLCNDATAATPCIRISVNSSSDMIHQSAIAESFDKPSSGVDDAGNAYFYCGMTSGQVSPSDTLDSGTCSDLDCTPPPLPKKKNGGVSITVIGEHHKRASSLASSGADVDSDDSEGNASCDSLNGNELQAPVVPPDDTFLPEGLLQDIRDQSIQLSHALIHSASPFRRSPNLSKTVIDESTYEERKKQATQPQASKSYDADHFYNFHLNEHATATETVPKLTQEAAKSKDEDSFAGYKDVLEEVSPSTIRSAKGTVRGVKNRVRAGIATFLQINSTSKSYKEKDAGKVVVYTTTMGIVRETYNNCAKVKQILRTLLVKFEERDVFMSCEFQGEILERMRCDHILVPQVFVDGQHVGDAETIERLNETGELRRILKPYKSMDACSTCRACGGYRLLPCPVCSGSKKSVHRNHFTAEFVALKCMNCDEVGLVRCSSC